MPGIHIIVFQMFSIVCFLRRHTEEITHQLDTITKDRTETTDALLYTEIDRLKTEWQTRDRITVIAIKQGELLEGRHTTQRVLRTVKQLELQQIDLIIELLILTRVYKGILLIK